MKFKQEANSKNVGVMCSLILLSFGAHCVLRGIVLPAIKDDFQMNYTEVSMLVSISMIGYFIMATLSTKLSALIGQKTSMSVFAVGLSVSAFAIVVSHHFALTAVMFFLAGCSYGGIEATGTAIVRRHNPREPDLAVNNTYSFYSVGSCFIAVLGGYFLWKGYGWRAAFAFVGILSAIASLYSFTVTEKASSASAPKASFSELRFLIKDPVLVVMCLATALLSGAEASSINWMNTFLYQTVEEMNIFETSCTTALFFASIYVGRLVISKLLEHYRSITLSIVFSILSGLTVLAISYVGEALSILICISLFGFFVSCLYPLLASITNGLSTRGIVYSFSFGMISLFNFLTNNCMGILADALGLRSTFRFCAILYLIVAGLVLACRRTVIARGGPANAT